VAKEGLSTLWLFGSSLATAKPRDLDVLLICDDRVTSRIIRRAEWWSHFDPPVDLLIMTAAEERHYSFIASTSAQSFASLESATK